MAERVKVDTSARKTLWQSPDQRDQLSDKDRQLLAENKEATKSRRDWIEKNGLPHSKYRPFWLRASTSSE